MARKQSIATGMSDEGGFTLIELLVGLALLALLATLLIAAVTGARQAAEFTERSAANASIGAVQGYLREAFTETHSLPWNGNGGEAVEPVFVGTKNHVSFLSGYVPRGQFSGLYRQELGVDALVSSQDLVVEAVLHRPGATPQSGSARQGLKSILLKNVSQVEFRYFVADNDNALPRWRDSWSHPFRLPIQVSIDVTFAPGDQRTWPQLIVAIPLSQR